MDLFALYGLAAHFILDYKNSIKNMNNDLKEKIPFFSSLKLLNEIYNEDSEYINHLNREILTDTIYPFYSNLGKNIELPIGSTVMDFACRTNAKLNNGLTFLVNGQVVNPDYILTNKDNVEVVEIPGKKLQKIKNVVTTEASLQMQRLN